MKEKTYWVPSEHLNFGGVVKDFPAFNFETRDEAVGFLWARGRYIRSLTMERNGREWFYSEVNNGLRRLRLKGAKYMILRVGGIREFLTALKDAGALPPPYPPDFPPFPPSTR